mgnify:FL=1
MKVAIISDIHANLEALTAVTENIHAQNISSIYALGDIVGYGIDPYNCIAYLKQHNISSVQGNHDYMAATNKYPSTISSMAKNSLEWTHKSLSKKSKQRLLNLPLVHKVTDQLVLTHASLYEPEKWHYLNGDDEKTIHNHFTGQMSSLCCVGHTHIPKIIKKNSQNQRIHNLTQESNKLELNQQYIINPGSVGFSRDLDYRASYATIELDDKYAQVNFHRIDYDRSTTLKKLKKNNADPKIIKHFS